MAARRGGREKRGAGRKSLRLGKWSEWGDRKSGAGAPHSKGWLRGVGHGWHEWSEGGDRKGGGEPPHSI
jgi:hypothetical protein